MGDSILVDIQEVFTEIGTTFEFTSTTKVASNNVYGESKKSTKTSIALDGMVTFNPKPEKLSDIGIQRKVSVLFKVAYQTLIDTGLYLISDENILVGQIKYKDKYYNIINYVPRSLYQGDFLIYNFECIRG